MDNTPHSPATRHHPLPEVVIWRAIRRYKIRRLTKQIRIEDNWLFEVALNGQLAKYHWPRLMHTPATLERISQFLEDLGALRKNSSAHARILILGLLLAGLRPRAEAPQIHSLAYCMAQLCDQPDAVAHRAMFISLYPQVCHHVLREFDSILVEIRTAANRPPAPAQPRARPRHTAPSTGAAAATAAAAAGVIYAPNKSKRTLAPRTQLPLLTAFLTSILRYIWIIYIVTSN